MVTVNSYRLPDKIPMNMLTKQQNDKVFVENTSTVPMNNVLDLDLNFLLDKPIKEEGNIEKNIDTTVSNVLINLVDVSKVDETRKPVEDVDVKDAVKSDESIVTSHSIKSEYKLSDLYVELKSIKPSNIPPIAVISDDNGINITLQFAKDKPKEDVTVIVVTISNKSETALKNILFRGIVPKVRIESKIFVNEHIYQRLILKVVVIIILISIMLLSMIRSIASYI